ncbi:UNVERIFIED_CONTAM: U-box domain-containing protein 3 [Sesamum angustifolium]|uniref:RING-type E3 ubiquitin transferase n=1 Tax=Sesamum angustifolium TaxID=2727405 RepID=A0AAW2KD43_9LAMI
MPAEKDYRNLVSLLKHLKPILDDVADHEAPQDEALSKECEELDIAVNEAREFLEKWSPRKSKLLFVLKSKPYVLKIQISSIKLSRNLHGLSESLPTNSILSNAQFCVQESQNLKLGQLSERIEEILRRQKEGKTPDAEHLMEIVESFNLGSSQELLNLMSHIRDCVVELGNFKSLNGIQIPSYFRCPLSLELMLDPVIVASGQTYERAAIQKWLDHGLVTCPKTGCRLSHKNLIPNYTVKALIANWCSENRVELSNNPASANTDEVQCHSESVSCEDDRQSQMGNSVPRSSNEVGHGSETEKVSEGYRVFREETDKLDQSSPEHSYVHSRSESASSAVSSIDYVPSVEMGIPRISPKQDNASDRLGDVKFACSTSLPNEIPGPSPLSRQEHNSSNTMAEMVVNGNHNIPRTPTFTSESRYNELTSTSYVEKLINDLKSVSTEVQTAAAGELRFLAKYNMENRLIIGQSGAIAPLISLFHSDVELTQEHAVTALLNLSINESIKARIAEEGALEPLIHALRTGNAGAKENAAAALFSISLLDEYRIKIGRSGAVKALVDLLGSGTFRGKKDAATALFNLSIFHENKVRIVQAGAVKYLVRFLDPATEMVDKAVALLANLSTVVEGCSALAREGGIPLLVEILETGSPRGKENAASILLQLCISSPKYCRSILQEGAVPPLVALSQSGTPRAKEKAQQLLSHFRSQRENASSRGRP